MRHFNTAGPIIPEEHYCIQPLERLDLEHVLDLIRHKKYFVLHAPRQTGKTSVLLSLRDLLNSGDQGAYRCVYANLEQARATRADSRETMRAVFAALASHAQIAIQDDFMARVGFGVLDSFGPNGALLEALRQWASVDPRPLVLLVDEIDTLPAESLLSILSQLRSGYHSRPRNFPHSVVLCGVRDVRDYPGGTDTGGSPFNISADSLRLGDLTKREVASLMAQHTQDLGQAFTPAAVNRVWTQTQGQPWLVNALCDQACFRSRLGRDRSRTITEGDIIEAQEELIMRRVSHIDQLGTKLREERVWNVIEPMLIGADRDLLPEDVEYVRDLGLLARDDPLRIANPIYAEVVPRLLTSSRQQSLIRLEYQFADQHGRLDMASLLEAFQQYFRENSEAWADRYGYGEAGPHLLLQAFLQRVVNGGGRIEREYALGNRRSDLLVVWPRPERTQRFAIECKLRRGDLERTIQAGTKQLTQYMDRSGADEGHLVIFDLTDAPWSEKIFCRREHASGASIAIWGM